MAHAGRTIPASLRRALIERDPACVVPGCDLRDGLEIDHVEPFALGGATSLANLVRLCHWHHYLKTHHGHRLVRVADGWRWEAPADAARGARPGSVRLAAHAVSSSPSCTGGFGENHSAGPRV